MSRKVKFTSWLFPLALVSLCAYLLFAQAAVAQYGQSGAGQSNTSTSVTGCLKQGGEKGGYYITGEDGTFYELVGKSVNLSQHVNHTVTVTGHQVKLPDSHESTVEQQEKTEAAGKSYTDLQVANLKMVSESCTQ